MQPRIETLPEKHFIGQFVTMSLSENLTYKLWSGFMPRKKEIEKTIGNELYSIEVYPAPYFEEFDPEAPFEKWAAVEVSDGASIPTDMQLLVVPKGQYAVFLHVGLTREAALTYQFIFEQWLPFSGHEIDTRPHLSIMGEKYNPNDPNSEEEIWIPIC